MNVFNLAGREARLGSARHARDPANCMTEDVQGLGPTDAGLAAAALRSYAGRWRRRCAAGLVAAGLATVAVIGVANRNADGRVDLADLMPGAAAVVSARLPAATGDRRPYQRAGAGHETGALRRALARR